MFFKCSTMIMSHLGQFLRTCSSLWAGLYLLLCFVCGLPHLMLHALGIGFLLCALSYLRLPPPSPGASMAFLGADPRNLDGSPSRNLRHLRAGPLGVIAHRCAGLDAPENTLAALRRAKKNKAK